MPLRNPARLRESRWALLFLAIGLLILDQFLRNRSEPWGFGSILFVVVIGSFIGVSLWIGLGRWNFESIEVDWQTKHYHLKETKIFGSRIVNERFQRITDLRLEKREYSEATAWVVLKLDDRTFPIFESMDKDVADAELAKIQHISQLGPKTEV